MNGDIYIQINLDKMKHIKMRYLETYTEYNEGLKSSLLTAGIAASMLATTPVLKAQTATIDKNLIKTTANSPKDGVVVIKGYANELHNLRKTEDQLKDQELAKILEEIKLSSNSVDSSKFEELFSKLKNHIESKYKFKFESKDVEKVSTAGVSEWAKNMSIAEILGWLGSICLAICGIPQAYQSYKDKHSEGISWGFVLLWAFGEIFALAYVYDKLDLPLLVNYATNILILAVILYYKIKPSVPIKESVVSSLDKDKLKEIALTLDDILSEVNIIDAGLFAEKAMVNKYGIFSEILQSKEFSSLPEEEVNFRFKFNDEIMQIIERYCYYLNNYNISSEITFGTGSEELGNGIVNFSKIESINRKNIGKYLGKPFWFIGIKSY